MRIGLLAGDVYMKHSFVIIGIALGEISENTSSFKVQHAFARILNSQSDLLIEC